MKAIKVSVFARGSLKTPSRRALKGFAIAIGVSAVAGPVGAGVVATLGGVLSSSLGALATTAVLETVKLAAQHSILSKTS